MQWHQLITNGLESIQIPVLPSSVQRRAEFRRDIGCHRDTTIAALPKESADRGIFTGQLTKFFGNRNTRGKRTRQIASSILNTNNVRQFRKPRHRRDRHVNDRSTGNIINDNGKIDRFDNHLVVQIQPVLSRLVVIRRYNQRSVCPSVLGMLRQFDRFGCRI